MRGFEQVRRIGQRAHPERPERRASVAADQPGREEQRQGVHQIRAHERGRESGSALDEQRGHLARAQHGERLLERGRRERLDAGGRCRCVRRRDAHHGRDRRGLREPGPGVEPSTAVEHDAQRQALRWRLEITREELGVIGQGRAAADRDRVELCPPGVHQGAARGRGDPAALAAARRDAAVEGRGQLEQHERATTHDVGAEGGVLAARPRLDRPAGELYLHAGRAQAPETAPVDLRVGIADGADDARDARREQGVGARRLATVVAARLERDVGRGPDDRLAAGVQRVALCVRLAAPDVPSLAQDASVAGDHAADERIRARAPASPLGQVERALEQLRVALVHASATSAVSACQASPGDRWS